MKFEEITVNSDSFHNSQETKKRLKISDCELAHIRNAGKLKFLKKGKAFYYFESSIAEYIQNRISK
jgi:hypothetical protein